METVNTIEHLKETLLLQIKSQEQVKVLFKKILTRITIIYISISVAILIGVMFIIYTLNKPESIAKNALREMEALNTRISIQREFIEMDRNDLEHTRQDVNNLIKIQDSLKRKK
ncbi:MAG TPA: hypothetical protein VIM07_15150 [Chitinophagaceae bacterium]